MTTAACGQRKVLWCICSQVPAISVPMAVAPGALPLGVQIVARPYDEAAVLRVAAVLEKNGATAP